MAGGRHPSFLRGGMPTTFFFLKSPLLFLLLLLPISLALMAAWELLSSSPHSPLLTPQHSFLQSLQQFLASSATPDRIAHDPSTTAAMPQNLDLLVGEREVFELSTHPLHPPLKVFVYNMPSKFTYDLLWLFHNSFEETANLTSNGSPVHRLIEQHSVDYWLWADLLSPESERLVKSVVRVHDQAEADIFYVPFFTTISFFLLEKPQRSLLYRVWALLPRRHLSGLRVNQLGNALVAVIMYCLFIIHGHSNRIAGL